ncbi:MAG: hypothetical protein ABFS03_08125 [Chloroflexota bacterium]
MTRFRAFWLTAMLGISLWITMPHSAVTASQGQMPTPTPTAALDSAPIGELYHVHYPGIIIGMLAVVGIIVLGALVLAKRR